MKLSRLYTNQPLLFSPVDFNEGLNVVLAEIRLPENKHKDTHNLGKSTLGKVLDFSLLKRNQKSFFLMKHKTLFEDFVFFLEIRLLDGTYLTVRRPVATPSKISFKRHNVGKQHFVEQKEWDHSDIPFKKSVKLLDGFLNLTFLGNFSFRKIVSYLIRSQKDYGDVFVLSKFKGKHRDWKPFLAHILGFDHENLSMLYDEKEKLTEKENEIKTIHQELRISERDIGKIEGILQLKNHEFQSKKELLEGFDFFQQDGRKIDDLVGKIDLEIQQKNALKYSAKKSLKKIQLSVREDEIVFDPEIAKKIFSEAGIYFDGQIKKSFQQLIEFNSAITEERKQYLEEEARELEEQLLLLNEELGALNAERKKSLSFLKDESVFDKYKSISQELIDLKADIISLEKEKDLIRNLEEKQNATRIIKQNIEELKLRIKNNVTEVSSASQSLFAQIRLYFNEIIHRVISRKALLNVAVNKEGNLDFTAEFLDGDENATSEDDGHSYKKLLCIAFDLAVLRAHLDDNYPRFVFHDGVFETLDDRKKENLLAVIREYTEMGIQSVITLIDSDLPPKAIGENAVFADEEVVLHLHDESKEGLLFKMDSW